MYCNVASNWSDGIGVVIKEVFEVLPICYARVDSGLLEDIEGVLCLF